ncbi:MAG TPA: glutamate-5-semialdehyde dehydrogenase [Azospirillaceae bacterium]|nr:glutamate-5-semialdehyde dehydrogenase [Azospirillaceae bacterium]
MTALAETTQGLPALMAGLGRAARDAASRLAQAPAAQKAEALTASAAAVRARVDGILAANARDVATAGDKGVKGPMLDRLVLDAARVEAIAAGLDAIAAIPDPVGAVLAEWTRPNGLRIQRVRVPLGVVGIIYESRPNVTADAGGLCIKSGNAAILRGGSDSLHSSRAIVACLHEGLRAAGLPETAVQLVPTADRAAVGELLRLSEYVDVIVPRGGRSLIERVQAESRIPVFAHLDGNCHVYVHAAADLDTAHRVVLNSKMRRVSVCGAAETLLVDRAAAGTHLPVLLAALRDAGCAIRGDEAVRAVDPSAAPATEADWRTEYLDAVIAVRVVDGLDEAIAHVNTFGSHHTDSIVTGDAAAAERFLREVDSAIVLHNASTQFADGGEFGFGAEIGISTGRLHARGPVGAEQLTTFKYVVRGDGQIRP